MSRADGPGRDPLGWATPVNLSSHLVQRMLKLGAPLTRDLVVNRDLRVPMTDGAELLADRWAPRSGGEGLPVALLRCPYGRRGIMGMVHARPLAERGYQVLIQSTRGTFGSGGVFDAMRCEREDGAATLEWLVEQPWFGHSIVLAGESYLGYAQWAVAARLPAEVKALIPQVTESAFKLEWLRQDGFSLEAPFVWGVQIATQERRWAMLRQRSQARKTQQALRTLPLSDADARAIGHHFDYIQACLVHDADDPYWSAADHQDEVTKVTVPVSLVGGWYDMYLPGQLRDFRALQQAGRQARLTIGPWRHTGTLTAGTRETLEFGLACARGDNPPPRAPVRLYVTGQEDWRDFSSWPPGGYAPQRFFLQPDGGLTAQPPPAAEPDRYRYDPADPTPAVGGVRGMPRKSGRVDNTTLEARSDVLIYSTDVLDQDVEVIGEVTAEIWFCSSLRYADVFVRLCDVDPGGRSWNVCDSLTSLTGANEVTCATVRLWPTAHRFRAGHRIRLQVSSGAFPRFARNLGNGESHATATVMRPADQQVYHDPHHPSAIVLPVKETAAA